MVIEFSLSFFPYESVAVNTPQGVKYEGKRCSVPMDQICGVSLPKDGKIEQPMNEHERQGHHEKKASGPGSKPSTERCLSS